MNVRQEPRKYLPSICVCMYRTFCTLKELPLLKEKF